MFLIYFLLGAITGTLSGMLGLGGGIIIVPALSALFALNKMIPANSVMHMAIGTSLAIMVLTSCSGMYAYHKRAAVRWDIVKKIVLSLVVGSLLGALVADALSSAYLQVIFGVFLLFLGLRMLTKKTPVKVEESFSGMMMSGIAGLIGLLSSILGVGGGTMFVPFFLRCRATMSEATGTSLACGMIIGIIATISFMFHGWNIKSPIPWSTGYIYWPAFFGVALTSVLLTPVGVMIAQKVPTAVLKKIFAVLMLVIATEMLWTSAALSWKF